MAFTPYLMFPGTCREAMTRYQEVLGGELQIMTMADMPPEANEGGLPDHFVMHSTLQLRDGSLLASDDPTSDGAPTLGMFVSYNASDVDDAHRAYAALADGGEEQLPIGPTFWSPAYGICRDRFGTPWMVSAPHGEG